MAEITIRISDTALKIALAVLLVVFLASGFSHLWSSGAFEPKYQILMFVPEAKGVQKGAPVRLDGMDVGSVSRVELVDKSADSNHRIEVELRIQKRFQNMIPDDSTASLIMGGLLGERYVSIGRGFAGPPINAGGEIKFLPVREVSFTDFIDAMGKKADCQNEEEGLPSNKSAVNKRKSEKPH